VNHRDFQTLANTRLAEAQLLHEAGFYDGAYYLAGYAVECALKACIARRTRMHDFPPTPNELRGIYTHRLLDLVKSADLAESLADRIRACRLFEGHWDIATQWSEESRYLRWSTSDADRLLAAISDPQHGVLRWLREHW
jgi:HEPN domain-containing protein